jgi:hypothetical protein
MKWWVAEKDGVLQSFAHVITKSWVPTRWAFVADYEVAQDLTPIGSCYKRTIECIDDQTTVAIPCVCSNIGVGAQKVARHVH